MTIAGTAYAKVNLALHVRERMSDGYHRIETLFAFCAHGDRLEVARSDSLTLDICGPFADVLAASDDNLVLRAARAVAAATGVVRGAAIRLEKRLPIAAGIGGGSADAAAAIRLLLRLWDVRLDEIQLQVIAAQLGADVPACLRSRTVRGDGRGDRLVATAADIYTDMPILLVNPRVAFPTGPVFRAWDGIDHGPMPDDPITARNDLQPFAIGLAPQIGAVLAALHACGGTNLVRMSGSGATCFALFANSPARDAADREIALREPGWWRMRSRLR